MASLQNSPLIHRTLFLYSFPQVGSQKHGPFPCSRRGVSFLVRAVNVSVPSTANRQGHTFQEAIILQSNIINIDEPGRRQILTFGGTTSLVSLLNQAFTSFAVETKKGFLPALDQKDGYSFLYPFGWQEIVIEGQDKVFKDIIEPLESVSVSVIPTSRQDIRDVGPPQKVAETLIEKVLVPPSQKTKLIEAAEHDVDGKAYYTFEFVAQAPNYTRHALAAISIGNGKFYILTTGANERRWGKMKDRLYTVVDSFKIFNV
ncbi:psbP-like protein 1, chloroplastic isoform X1 [Malania oleifera]|uniref:psbP-like protein 1, chloroplastic isoform X1 n=1 Tax=Malania oleifera TaxID=397392 RepID=UPI0025ADAF43|nr:psbP-like protein 1, chloroplastic isoform X1 [Malania oleifera]